MKFAVEEEIPDLPSEVMEIVAQCGGSVQIGFGSDVDDDGHDYADLRVEILGGTDEQSDDMFAALDTLEAYQQGRFDEIENGPWYQSWLPGSMEWIEAWEAEMKRRFPAVTFE